MATLNLVAFAIHAAVEIADAAWSLALKTAGARIRFFGCLRAITVFILFPSWTAILETLVFQVLLPQPP